MNLSYQEKKKWDAVFERQRIRNLHEAEYWRIILRHQRIHKMINRFIFADFILFTSFCFYICFF